MDIKTILEEFQDFAAPKLDTYEQAIYLYIFRHSRLQSQSEITIGFKSARRRLALGVGTEGVCMAEGTCYKKLQSLEAKGFIKLLGTEREGTRIRLFLPNEIEGLIPSITAPESISLEDMDFVEIQENRLLILRRENDKCFYCLRAITENQYIIEHVISRPQGTNSYRNVVASCRQCNNRKGSIAAENFIRSLYRDGYLGAEEFKARVDALQKLASGELKPMRDI